MAHKEQKEFVRTVKERYPEFFAKGTVLDIGSLDVNGSFREEHNKIGYVGVDIAKGKGVDIVSKGHEFSMDEAFDTVCSGECFEHDEYYHLTIPNMYKHLRAGGLMYFTCATTGRAEHGTKRSPGGLWGTSPDYYKNLTEEDIRAVLDVDKLFSSYEFSVNTNSHDLYFVGIKVSDKPKPKAKKKATKKKVKK